MSYQGQTWVDEVAFPLLKNSGELLVMLRVANHAGNGPAKMSGCFMASPNIAAECLLKPRAVQEHLRNLTERGLLVPGDPQLVAHLRADRRPPVYDLGGAHVPGCPGGHDIDGECLPAATGSKNHHPSTDEQNPRSAGSRKRHPSTEAPATGSKKRPSRVAKSATKSSKELKDLSPRDGAPSSGAAEAAPPAPTDERETAAQDDKPNPTPPLPAQREALPDTNPDTAQVLAAYEEALSGKALNGTRTQLLADAAELLAARPLWWVIDRARELPRYGKSLAKHAEMSRVPFTTQPAPGGSRERCPEHPTHYRGRCYKCAMAVPV